MKTYTCGKHGGRAVIAMPLELLGEKFKRQIWKNGIIAFKKIKK